MTRNNWFSKISFYFLLILIIGLPFHGFITTFLGSLLTETNQDYISSTNFLISAWKEILMVIMAGIIIFNAFLKKKLPFKFLLIDYLILVLLIWALISAYFQSASLPQGLLGIRFNFEFFIFYWIVRGLEISVDQVKTLLKSLLIVSAIVIALGFVQINLPCESMTSLGYTPYESSWVASKPLPCGHNLGENSDTIRMMSTFSGPNQLASFLLIVIMIGWTLLTEHIRKYKGQIFMKYAYVFFIAISLTAFYLTYSRGALIALLAAFLSMLLLQVNDSKKIFGYFIFGLVITTLLFIGNTVLNPERMESTREHFEKPLEGLNLIIQKPWGYGLGMAGPVSLRFPPDGSKAMVSESWYLQIVQEFGILGGLLFFLLLSYILRFLYQRNNKAKNIEAKDFITTIIAVYIGLLVNNLFLHTWSSDMITSLIFWCFFGIVVNLSLDKSTKSSELPDKA